jgi:hypothetical protein
MSDDKKSITINLPDDSATPKREPKKKTSKEDTARNKVKNEILKLDWDDFEIYAHENLRNQNYKLRLPAHSAGFDYQGFQGKTLPLDDIYSVLDGTDLTLNEFLAKGLPSDRSWQFRLVQGTSYVCSLPSVRLTKIGGDANSKVENEKTEKPKKDMWSSFGNFAQKMEMNPSVLGGVLMGAAELAKAFRPETETKTAPPPPQQDTETKALLQELINLQKESQRQSQETQSRSELAEVVKAFAGKEPQSDTDQWIKLITVLNQTANKSDPDNDMIKMFLEQMIDQRKIEREEMKDMLDGISSGNDPIEQMERIEEFKARLAPTLSGPSMTPPIATGKEKKEDNSTLDRLADVAVNIFEGVQKRQQQSSQQEMERLAYQQRQEVEAQRQAQFEAERISQMVGRGVEDPTAAPSMAHQQQPEPEPVQEVDELTPAQEKMRDNESALQQMVEAQVDGMQLLLGVKTYIEQAQEAGLLDQVQELVSSNWDLPVAFEMFVRNRTDNQDYINQVLAAAEPFRAALTDVELREDDPTDSQQQDDKIISVNPQEVDDDIQGNDMGSTIPDDAPAETQINS